MSKRFTDILVLALLTLIFVSYMTAPAVTNAGSVPVLSVTPKARNFGNLIIGAGQIMWFEVGNIGAGTLIGNASIVGTGFSIIGNNSYSLDAGQTTKIAIVFRPTAAVDYNATVTFTGGAGATVNVTGAGITEPKISVIQSTLNDGGISFAVQNTGGGVLAGTCVIDGKIHRRYNLAAGQSKKFSVQLPFVTEDKAFVAMFTGGGGTAVSLKPAGQPSGRD